MTFSTLSLGAVLFCCLCTAASGNLNPNIKDYTEFVLKMSTNQTFTNSMARHIKSLLKDEPNYYDYSPFRNDASYKFSCKIEKSAKVPATVHELRPADIKVVAGMGDSLTAALAGQAKTPIGILYEYRGVSWSMGGAKELEQHVTLPNILKKYNPNLVGYLTRGDTAYLNEDGVGLNCAVSGQEANHIPAQARKLVERMQQERQIDMQNDWKVLTLLIGGNDLCRWCSDPEKHSPANYIKDVKKGLDIIYENIPRVFVNLVSVLNVSKVINFNKGLACSALHIYECECGAYPKGDQEEILLKYIDEYRNLTAELVNSGRYDQRDDFTVVLQPFLHEFDTPIKPNGKRDFTFLAPDCFHFSAKGHSTVATGLWNNMLQPVGEKRTNVDVKEPFRCPTEEHPYFFTKKNSIKN